MIGTLIDLIIMLQNLQDTSQIGKGLAVAMLTTLYGSIIANMIAIPLITNELFYKGETVGANAQVSKPDIQELIGLVDKLVL